MWLQPPPPVADWWTLHIAASPHQVDDVLADLCIHHRAHPIDDPEFPAYLAGRYSPAEPPAWMSLARAELDRRGHPARWCDPSCDHDTLSRTSPQSSRGDSPGSSASIRSRRTSPEIT